VFTSPLFFSPPVVSKNREFDMRKGHTSKKKRDINENLFYGLLGEIFGIEK
jgi:hypothetical protein